MSKNKKVVVIGGGTGTYTTLLGLREHPLDISVIVSMTDSGGSNRIIRDEFGLLPTSDLRQVIVALASPNSSNLFRKLFSYRYTQGTGISGMTFGNLFMAAISDILGSQSQALEETCSLLRVKGHVLPVTWENTNLVARYDNGKQVLGEHQIDEPSPELADRRIVELEVFPPVKVNPQATKAIKEADAIIFAPGDLYTSLICNLVVGSLSNTIKKSSAKKIYVTNLMTKYGQTHDLPLSKQLSTLNHYLGGEVINTVLVNNNYKISPSLIRRYRQEKAELVVDDLTPTPYKKLKVVRTDLLSSIIYEKQKSDKLIRSLIRHDPQKLTKALLKLL